MPVPAPVTQATCPFRLVTMCSAVVVAKYGNRHGHGQSGQNRDYVLATVQALEAMGCRDRELHLLAERLHGVHEVHAG